MLRQVFPPYLGHWFTRTVLCVLAGLTLLGGLIRDAGSPKRPERTVLRSDIARGITYRRHVLDTPRPVVIHLARVELRTPGMQVWVTPGESGLAGGMEVRAMTTRDFAGHYDTQLAVNASYFYPFQEHALWGYPRAGDPVNVVGQAISAGVSYSDPHPTESTPWMMLCFDAQNQAQITQANACPAATQQALAGNEMLVWAGQPTAADRAADAHKPYPRTAVGVDRAGEILWIVAVDGKQPGYSEGMTLPELALFLAPLGLEAALNLDGGGSTTMVGPRQVLLNSPIHQVTVMRERPVANHLGFRVQ